MNLKFWAHIRNTTSLIITAVLLISSMAATAGAQSFKIFDATLYSNKPDSASTGMTPITLVGAYGVSPAYSREWKANPKTALPTKEEVRDLVQRLKSQGSTRVAFDFEEWSEDPQSIDDTANKFKELISRFHDAAPDIKVGIYSYVPAWNFYASLAPVDSKKYKLWQSQNDRLKSLADVVDFLAPQLYTYSNDSNQWATWAIATVREGKRIAPNKPIYPFIWPQFDDSNQAYLPKQLWEVELQTLSEHADGVIIWGGWGMNHGPAKWNPNADWWLSTQKLISHNSKN